MDVTIAPSDCNKLQRVRLPRPKDGQGQHFFYDEQGLALYEVVSFADKYRSWFIDNLLCSDGHFRMLTRLDPLFLFVPLVLNFTSDKFRSLEDICGEYNANFMINSATASDSGVAEKYDRIDYALAPDINWSNICDVKDIDGELYMRFNRNKAIDWLLMKHNRLMECLKSHLGEKTSKATLMSHATDLIAEYIPESMYQDFKKEVRDMHLLTSGDS